MLLREQQWVLALVLLAAAAVEVAMTEPVAEAVHLAVALLRVAVHRAVDLVLRPQLVAGELRRVRHLAPRLHAPLLVRSTLRNLLTRLMWLAQPRLLTRLLPRVLLLEPVRLRLDPP